MQTADPLTSEVAAFLERDGLLLRRVGYLFWGGVEQADRAVAAAVGTLAARWTHLPDPRVEALRLLVRADPAVLADQGRRPRVELSDVVPDPPAATDPLVADLLRLPAEERAALLLERWAETPTPQIASILDRTVDEVHRLSARAHRELAARDPARASDATLSRQFAEAVSRVLPPEPSAADATLRAGRASAGAAQGRRTTVAAVAGLAVGLVIAAMVAIMLRPIPAAAPSTSSPSPSPTPPAAASCDLSETACRTRVLLRWRAAMSEIVQPYVDPEGTYFSGFGYSDPGTHDPASYWAGGDGALAVQLVRLEGGATEVYVQIASSRRYAVRCGHSTEQRCRAQRFMDGNVFLLSESTSISRGLEVQYSPSGEEVITAVARTRGSGPQREVSRGDLINLVEDPRLRLPPR